MPRALSNAARVAMFSQEGGAAVFLVLLEITHSSITPIRVVNNTQPITHLGNVYIATAFVISPPAERDDRPPEVRLRIDNADRLIVEGVRLLTGPPTITMTIVIASQPDEIEAGPFVFTLRGVEYDAMEVSGALMFEDLLNDSYPLAAFTPANFPGLFKDI